MSGLFCGPLACNRPAMPSVHERVGIAPARKLVALRRLALLQRLHDLVATGVSQNQAADKLGRPGAGGPAPMTLVRWRLAYQRRGFAGLLPQHHRSGRKPKRQEVARP